MSRRLSILATVILLLFAVAAAQSANVQFFRSKALDASPINPRNTQSPADSPRGKIIAADGKVLAFSTPTGKGRNVYRRIYPLGALTSGVVGFASPTYGSYFLEAYYSNYLASHSQAPQSFAQLLAPTTSVDNVVLTLQPSLQRVAQKALAGRDGAAVVLDPRNGNILAMYSNPTYNPVPLTSTDSKVALAAWKTDIKNNANGFPPLGLLAIQQRFPPGSTFKVITTSAVIVSDPQLLSKVYPGVSFIIPPNTKLKLYNFGKGTCGGTIAEMLPPSCDTGFAQVGLDVGGAALAKAANSFGYNQKPPIDLPGAVASVFPSASSLTFNQPGVAYSAIGQQNVATSALMNALVAASIGNGGVMMTPHLLDYVTSADGSVIHRYKPIVWKTPLTSAQAGQIVPLMVAVASRGTAYGYFPAVDDVGAKTGTAQTGTHLTDDWMIAFAPASAPTIAVAVVMPFQAIEKTGALVAGPIMTCLVEGALSVQSGHAASGISGTCPK